MYSLSDTFPQLDSMFYLLFFRKILICLASHCHIPTVFHIQPDMQQFCYWCRECLLAGRCHPAVCIPDTDSRVTPAIPDYVWSAQCYVGKSPGGWTLPRLWLHYLWQFCHRYRVTTRGGNVQGISDSLKDFCMRSLSRVKLQTWFNTIKVIIATPMLNVKSLLDTCDQCDAIFGLKTRVFNEPIEVLS